MWHVRGKERFLQGLMEKPREKRSHLEGLAIVDRIIIKWIFEKLHTGTDWIDLARWRAVVNAIVILRVT
jgi:hypothetical protein